MKNLSEYFLCFYLKLMDLLRNERGQTLIEYALLLVLIALVVYIMVNQLGHTTNNVFCNIDSALGKAPVTP